VLSYEFPDQTKPSSGTWFHSLHATFARLAADAHRWVGEKPNFNIFLHVRVPALVRAVCPLANHKNLMRKAGAQELNTEGKMPMKLLLISALLRS
jgi:hypothetical protein